jgi:hypothetical protein
MTGPIRDELTPRDPEPDAYDLVDPEPLPSPERQPDLWDQTEGVPTDLEDIAIVAYEALRAYRTTQGSGSGRPWMNQTQEERNDLVELVARYSKPNPNERLIGPPEALLVAYIVKALTAPATKS